MCSLSYSRKTRGLGVLVLENGLGAAGPRHDNNNNNKHTNNNNNNNNN